MFTIELTLEVDGLQNALCYPRETHSATLEVPFEVYGCRRGATLYTPEEYPEISVLTEDIVVLDIDGWTPNVRQDATILDWIYNNVPDFETNTYEKCVNYYTEISGEQHETSN